MKVETLKEKEEEDETKILKLKLAKLKEWPVFLHYLSVKV